MDIKTCSQAYTANGSQLRPCKWLAAARSVERTICSGQAAQCWRGATRPGARLSENPCQLRLIRPKEDKYERNDSLEMSRLGTLNRDN